MTYLKLAILKTIHYADIFSYPLYQHQLWFYLISAYPISKKAIENALSSLRKEGRVIKQKNKNLYALKGKKKLFKLRKYRNKLSRKKLHQGRRVASILAYIPTVQLIGVSGGLSINNAKKTDDIDFFIVTSSGYLWLTRLILILLLEIMRVRRRPSDENVSNKICLNMIVDKKNLSPPFPERDIFSAHEVLQMKPIFVRGDTFERFLWKNRWVRELMANSRWKIKVCKAKIEKERDYTPFRRYLSIVLYLLTRPLELMAKFSQLIYMYRHKTTEIVQDGYLRFHPEDQRLPILSKFQWRVANLKRLYEKELPIYSTPFPDL